MREEENVDEWFFMVFLTFYTFMRYIYILEYKFAILVQMGDI